MSLIDLHTKTYILSSVEMAWIYKRGGVWWIGWRASGKQFLESTGESDEKKAEDKLREFEFLHNANKSGKLTERFIESFIGAPPVPKVTLKAAIDDWLEECRGSVAPATIEKYETTSRRLCEYLKANNSGPMLRDVTPDAIRAFLAHRRGIVAASTANLDRAVIGVFFMRELRNERIHKNPLASVKAYRENKAEKVNRRAFTLDEVKSIYSMAPNIFWKYMILGGFYTGLRLGDLVMMRWKAVNFAERSISVLTRKTGKTVHIPIAEPFRQLLEQIHAKKEHRAVDFVWPEKAASYERHKARIFSVEFYDLVLVPAGLVKKRTHQKSNNVKREHIPVSFHSLRHTNISFLKSTGSNSAVARALVGHSSDEINDLYTHLPMETLTKAVSQLPVI